MSTRLWSLLAVSAVLVVTGCSAGETPVVPLAPPTTTASGSGSQEPTSTPGPVKYEDFPGDGLVYYQITSALGSRIKPIEAVWQPEFADKTAAAGKQFLVVYVAATPELADRGTRGVVLGGLKLRFDSKAGDCASQTVTADGRKSCYHEPNFRSNLDELHDGGWRGNTWTDTYVTGTDLAKGQTKVGVVAFGVSDTADPANGFELCAPLKGKSFSVEDYPCVPVESPEKPRG